MKSTYLVARFTDLDNTISKAKALSATNIELEGYLAAYLVVLISGAYEDCIEWMFAERAAKAGDSEVTNYVQTTLDILFRNPEFGNIVRAVKFLSEALAEELKNRVDTKAKEAVNSIVTNKNNVSHGKVSAATLGDVEGYHQRSIPVFDALEDILGLP